MQIFQTERITDSYHLGQFLVFHCLNQDLKNTIEQNSNFLRVDIMILFDLRKKKKKTVRIIIGRLS